MSDDVARGFLEQLEQEEQAAAIANEKITPAGKRKCPICGGCMRHEMQESVQIDVCDAHGVWLDRNELAMIIRRHVSQEGANNRKLIEDLKRRSEKEKTSLWLCMAGLIVS